MCGRQMPNEELKWRTSLQGESSLVLFWIFMRLTALKNKEVDETGGVSVHVLAGLTRQVAGLTDRFDWQVLHFWQVWITALAMFR